jgi:hypothetical protein
MGASLTIVRAIKISEVLRKALNIYLESTIEGGRI